MPLAPNDKKEFRLQLARYYLVAEKYRAVWHYSQVRAFWGYEAAPSAPHLADCSAYSSLGFYAAGKWSHAPVHDPLDRHYSGIGNTTSAYAYLRAHHAPENKYLIGDIALYLEGEWWHHHMTICRTAGTSATAIFSSNGSEAGPQPEHLHYRRDLTGVFRHPALL